MQGAMGHLLDSSTYQSPQPKGSICSAVLPALPASPPWHAAELPGMAPGSHGRLSSLHGCGFGS